MYGPKLFLYVLQAVRLVPALHVHHYAVSVNSKLKGKEHKALDIVLSPILLPFALNLYLKGW